MPIIKTPPRNFDDYVERFPNKVQRLVKKVRLTIRKAAPGATEKISYGMPSYALDGILVWFAAHKTHIGFYPRKSAIIAFKSELSSYKGAKGSVQFPFDRPLPLSLISRIVKFRIQENRSKKNKK